MEHLGDIKVCNKSFDIAGFLSVLSPKTGAAQLGFSAPEFAERVLGLQAAINVVIPGKVAVNLADDREQLCCAA
jgi:hypothetical protein